MGKFSERYGYTKPSDIIIREKMPIEIQNAICSCYDRLNSNFASLGYNRYSGDEYIDLENYLWTYFMNRREGDFRDGRSYHIVATLYIEDKSIEWYKKLDIIEETLNYLIGKRFNPIADLFAKDLNSQFERLNFAYRIIDYKIVEVSVKEEIVTIEEALQDSSKSIRSHISKAIELYAKKPSGDYRNSIKESISAVEAFCRLKTGENTFGKALNALESKGIIIPGQLKTAFDKLYSYTNQPETGIRHALMDDTGSYTPKAEEALFMLVSCSAFINYLAKKI